MRKRRPPGRDASELNDPALKAKVESELFRPEDAPKGSVDVSVEEGVVYLRGQVADRDRVARLETEAASIDGVQRVVNLVHADGEPAT